MIYFFDIFYYEKGDDVCQFKTCIIYIITPRVILVLNDLLSGRIYDRYDVALQIVDVPI